MDKPSFSPSCHNTGDTGLWAGRQNMEHPGIIAFQGVLSYTRVPYCSVPCAMSGPSRSQTLGWLPGHGTPWNGIIPGCSMVCQGPTSKCPIYQWPAVSVTTHWTVHQQITLFWTVLDRAPQSPRAHSLVHSGQLCPDRHSCELLSKVVLIAHYCLDC